MEDNGKSERIRKLNDRLRRTGFGGRVLITHGINDLGESFVANCIQAMQRFADFSEDNDPYGEHDFGALDVDGQKVFWKIDYYDLSMEYGSSDPSDPSVTTRVLTLMLASEY